MSGVKQTKVLLTERKIMNTYTKELQDEIDRVTLKGNADKYTIRKLASIIFRMDQRIGELEAKSGIDQPKVEEEVPLQEAPPPPPKRGVSIKQPSAPATLENTPAAKSEEK